MNQVTNLIQHRNLTQEQKRDFNFENYKYESQGVFDWEPKLGSSVSDVRFYRLVIEDDKWYYWHGVCISRSDGSYWDDGVCKGSEVTNIGRCSELRPAKESEIPVSKEKTLEEKIEEKWPDKEVVMLDFGNTGILEIQSGPKESNAHIVAQSMKGFYNYVYQLPQGDSFFLDAKAVYRWDANTTLQPLVALFEDNK